MAMGSSWVSGIRLYAVVATLGLLGRFAHLRLPGELEVLTNWWVIGIALGLLVIEFFADKMPYVDSTWDVIGNLVGEKLNYKQTQGETDNPPIGQHLELARQA